MMTTLDCRVLPRCCDCRRTHCCGVRFEERLYTTLLHSVAKAVQEPRIRAMSHLHPQLLWSVICHYMVLLEAMLKWRPHCPVEGLTPQS